MTLAFFRQIWLRWQRSLIPRCQKYHFWIPWPIFIYSLCKNTLYGDDKFYCTDGHIMVTIWRATTQYITDINVNVMSWHHGWLYLCDDSVHWRCIGDTDNDVTADVMGWRLYGTNEFWCVVIDISDVDCNVSHAHEQVWCMVICCNNLELVFALQNKSTNAQKSATELYCARCRNITVVGSLYFVVVRKHVGIVSLIPPVQPNFHQLWHLK